MATDQENAAMVARLPVAQQAHLMAVVHAGPTGVDEDELAASVQGGAEALALLVSGRLLTVENGRVRVASAALPTAVGLHACTLAWPTAAKAAGKRSRRSAATVEDVVRRVVLALADLGPLTYSTLSARHVSAKQRSHLDAALNFALEGGAVRRAPGQRWEAVNTSAVGVTDEDVLIARERRVERAKRASGKFAGEGQDND